MEKLTKLRMWALSHPVVVAVLFLPYCKPQGLATSVAAADWVFVLWKGLTLVLAAALFLSRPRVTAVTALMGVYQALLLLSTVTAHGSLMEWAYTASGAAGFCLLMELALGTDPKAAVKGFVWLLGGLCLVNLATVLLCPGGLYREDVYFIGPDNANALYILPLLGAGMICAAYGKRPLALQIGMLAVFSASVYITWSATAVLSVTAFIALALLYRVKGSGRLFNIGVYYAAFVALFLLVVVFRVQDHMAFFIEGVLHKDVSLTDRVPLWDAVTDLIRRRPLLGYGALTDDMMWGLVGKWHCHNVVLQVLFNTGAVGLGVYLAMLGCIVRPLMRRREHVAGYMLAAAMGALLLDFMAESPIYPLPYYGVLLMSAHVEEIAGAFEAGRTLP